MPITEADLRETLWDWNFWDQAIPDEFIGQPRRLTDSIRSIATGREAVAIVGVRRCGKTTIMYQLMQRLAADGCKRQEMLYVNLEDHRFGLDRRSGLLDRILALYRSEIDPSGPRFLFLDEPQAIEDWERWVLSQYDRGPTMRIFITGSSSSLMSSEMSTLLSGRNLTFPAYPYSFAEHLRREGVAFTEAGDPLSVHRENRSIQDQLMFHLGLYLERGGFPEAVKRSHELHRRTLLQQYFDDILAKDVIRRHRLRSPRLLTDLALVLMSEVGNLVSLGRLARTLGSSASSVGSLLEHLEEARLMATTRFFSFSTKESVAAQKPRKVYAVDTGLRNAVVSRPTGDRGWLAENLAHNHLVHLGLRPSYWKARNEVDLVIGTTDPVPINVCFTDEIPDRELKGLEQFHDQFANELSLVVTRNTFDRRMIGRSECLLVPLWSLLLAEEPIPQPHPGSR